MLKNSNEENTAGQNQGLHLNFHHHYSKSYRREGAQFTWLILSQYLLIFSLFLLFTTQMLFTSFSLLIMFGYFFSVIVNQVTASNKLFLLLLTGFVFALSQDVAITMPLSAKLLLLLSPAFYFHAKLATIIKH